MLARLTALVKHRPWLAYVFVGAGFLLASCVLFVRLWIDVDNRMLLYTHADQQGFEWFIKATTKLILSGRNPLFTDWQNAPSGINLMAQTSILGLSIPLIPVTLLFGPQATFAVILTVAPAATATAWYWFFTRRLGFSVVSALIAASLCGFSPPLISHANGAHLNFISLFLMPFIVSATLRLREAGQWLRGGLVLGLLVTYQIFIGEEPLLIAALGILVFIVAWSALTWPEAKAVAKPFGAGIGVAGAVTLVLSAWPLWWQFHGPQSYGAIPHASKVGNDLVALTTFASQSLGGGHPVGGALAMNPSEENAFLGWPLLVLTVVIVIWLWRTSVLARALAVTAGVLLVFSLGVEITYQGKHTHIPGPWLIFAHTPLFGSILPGRITFAAIPAIAALLGLATDRILQTGPIPQVPLRLLWFGALAAVLVPIAPTPVERAERAPVPVFFTDGQWRQYVDAGGVILTLPPPNGSYAAPLRWQIETDMGFRNVDGYFIGPNGADNHGWYGAPVQPTTELFYRPWQTGEVPVITDAVRQQAAADLKFWGVQAVVLGLNMPHEAELLATAQALFGPGTQTGGVWVWDLRHSR